MVEIQEVAKANGAGFATVVIPDMQRLSPDLEVDYPGLIEELEVFLPDLRSQHYNPEEAHFNVEGHAFYAAFLDSLIRQKIKAGAP